MGFDQGMVLALWQGVKGGIPWGYLVGTEQGLFRIEVVCG